MKIKIILLAVFIFLISAGCVNGSVSGSSPATTDMVSSVNTTDNADADSPQKSAPLVWKISDDDSSVYMMGTIHAGDKNTADFESYVDDVYSACPAIAVECDTIAYSANSERVQTTSQMLLLNDGTTTKEHIDTDIYNDVVELMKKHNLYSNAYEYYIPFVWVNQLSGLALNNSGLSYDYGVDVNFINKAYADNKAIYEIESIEEQYAVFDGISDEYFNLVFRQALADNYIDDSAAALKQLYTAWHDGDIALLAEISEDEGEFNSEDEIQIYQQYYDIMIAKRNITMKNAAEQFLGGSENVFMLVGSLHYIGDDGIIALLKKDGYSVEQVKPQ